MLRMRWGGRCRLCFGGATSPGMDTTDPGREKVTQLQGAGTEIISWSSVLHLLGKKGKEECWAPVITKVIES